jgi:argininosuccinate lyase
MQSTIKMILFTIEKEARARGYIVALVTLRKDLPVSDNRDIQYNCEGYMALALVVQETFSSLLVVTLNSVRMTCHVGCRTASSL